MEQCEDVEMSKNLYWVKHIAKMGEPRYACKMLARNHLQRKTER
jgi:hypothetical protein